MRKLFITLLAVFLSSAVFAQPITQFVILGDSLSDNGNLLEFLKIVPKSPPYYKGRFSNGPNWADHVESYFYKKYFIDTKNYSYGGATAFLHNILVDKFIAPITLEGELGKYLLETMFTDRSHVLFGIWIGANDYLYDRQPSLENLTDKVVNTTMRTMNLLILSGAKQFLVFNLPDLSLTPYAKNTKLTDRLRRLSEMHNRKLANRIKELKSLHPDVKIIYMDIYTTFTDVMHNPEKYNQQYGTNITDIEKPCWLKDWFGKDPDTTLRVKHGVINALKVTKNKLFAHSDYSLTAELILQSPSLAQTLAVGQAYDDNDKPCENADEHIFWDIIHPSAVVHQVLGELVIQKLAEAGY